MYDWEDEYRVSAMRRMLDMYTTLKTFLAYLSAFSFGAAFGPRSAAKNCPFNFPQFSCNPIPSVVTSSFTTSTPGQQQFAAQLEFPYPKRKAEAN